ncbi:MAG: hypothetical protein U0L98_06690 [Clostridia bacterium]|nr:hypothetical protein [Clostridia bacterium]
MENASKALIIAGAILLAILIISLGILIFSQAQDTVGSVNMSEQEIMAFNNKFTAYEGKNKRGTEVNALIQAVRTNNQSAHDSGATEKIINISSSDSVVSTNTTDGSVEGSVTKGDMYDVSMTYVKGLIHTITIKKAGSE